MTNKQDYKVQDLMYFSFFLAYIVALFFVIKHIIKLMILSFKGYKITLKDYAKVICDTLEVFGFKWFSILIFNILHIIIAIVVLITPTHILIELFTMLIVVGFIIIYTFALIYSWDLAIKAIKERLKE